MSERWVPVELDDGRSLEAVVQGAEGGTLLIFHHGSPSSAQPFEPFHRAASERDIVLAFPSRAGFGGSTRQEGRTVASAAADAAALADHLGHERFLGHLSLGVGAIGEILDDLLEASGAGASTIEG